MRVSAADAREADRGRLSGSSPRDVETSSTERTSERRRCQRRLTRRPGMRWYDREDENTSASLARASPRRRTACHSTPGRFVRAPRQGRVQEVDDGDEARPPAISPVTSGSGTPRWSCLLELLVKLHGWTVERVQTLRSTCTVHPACPQQLFLARARLVDVDRRENALVTSLRSRWTSMLPCP